jgi:hypothetical protein
MKDSCWCCTKYSTNQRAKHIFTYITSTVREIITGKEMNQGQHIVCIRKEDASHLIEMSVLRNNLHQTFQENITKKIKKNKADVTLKPGMNV